MLSMMKTFCGDGPKKQSACCFRPLRDTFQADPTPSISSASEILTELLEFDSPGQDSKIWHQGLCGLQPRLGVLAGNIPYVELSAIKLAFPIHSDEKYIGDPRYCAHGLLYWLVHQFLGELYADGKILCLAEDQGRFSPLPYGELFMAYTGELSIPLEGDYWSPKESDDEDLIQSGADRIWYAFTRDLLPVFSNQEETLGPSSKPRRGPRTRRDIEKEKKTAAALKRLETSLKTRPLKADVLKVLIGYVGSEKAAKRVWHNAELFILERWGKS